MKFPEFRRYQPKPDQNVFAFICEDPYFVEQSRDVWRSVFSGEWLVEKYTSREFEDISASRLMDDALTPSLFSQNKLMLVNAEKLTKTRVDDLSVLQGVGTSSLKVVLVFSSRKSADAVAKGFATVEIDSMKLPEVARWLVETYGLGAEVARYLVDNVGIDLFTLRNEVEKLRTYVGSDRRIETRDVDALVLRSEQFGAFELEDAVLARNYKRAVEIVGAMLEDGVEPLKILGQIVRVWRQLLVGKGLVGRTSAKDVAIAAAVVPWKAADFVAACRKFEWNQLALGFRELLYADRAFKSSSPNPGVYFDVMLWKLIG